MVCLFSSAEPAVCCIVGCGTRFRGSVRGRPLELVQARLDTQTIIRVRPGSHSNLICDKDYRAAVRLPLPGAAARPATARPAASAAAASVAATRPPSTRTVPALPVLDTVSLGKRSSGELGHEIAKSTTPIGAEAAASAADSASLAPTMEAQRRRLSSYQIRADRSQAAEAAHLEARVRCRLFSPLLETCMALRCDFPELVS